MRIISGSLKGRRISPPKNLPVRPTTDRAKESLFNILAHQYNFDDCAALDLYAGTGSISYEFASRGVAAVTAVDQSAACVRFINETSERLDLSITPVKSPVEKFLAYCGSTFHFIFADPPYAFTSEQYKNLITTIFDRALLNKDGVFVVEHAPQIDLATLPHFSASRNYGGCVFSFFEK